jgi:hypothetical protein
MRKRRKPEAKKWMVWARITQAHPDRKKENDRQQCRKFKLRRPADDFGD